MSTGSTPAADGGRDPKSDAAAADWLAKRDRGFTAVEEREFAQWLAMSPAHAAAWRECEEAWRMLDAAREGGWGGEMQRKLAQRQQQRRVRRVKRALAACGVAAAIVVTFFYYEPAKPDSREPAAVAGVAASNQAHTEGPAKRVLADGSVITLEADAQVEVALTAKRRAVRLLRGEALFAVAKDAARPFVVSSGGVEVWAVGTAFRVRVDAHAVALTVTEGKVAVNYAQDRGGAEAAPAAEHLLVTAGNRVVVPRGERGIEQLRPAAISAPPTRSQLVEFSDSPLREIVALLNRESAVRLTIADPALEELRLSGVFKATDGETLARLLEANYDVSVERDGDRVVLRRK